MSLTLELTADLEDRLTKEAKAHGMTVEAYIQDVLEYQMAQLPRYRFTADDQARVPHRSNGVRAVTGRIVGPAPPPKDRSREFHWLAAHRDEYAGEWVALDGDRLLAHGSNLKEVSATARSAGINDALLVRVESGNTRPTLECSSAV